MRIRGIGINLLSEFSGGVAKLFLNGYRVGARRKGNVSVVVPSIVKADSCNACLGYQLFEIVVDRLVYQVPACFIGEDQAGELPFIPRAPRLAAVGILELALLLQCFDSRGD